MGLPLALTAGLSAAAPGTLGAIGSVIGESLSPAARMYKKDLQARARQLGTPGMSDVEKRAGAQEGIRSAQAAASGLTAQLDREGRAATGLGRSGAVAGQQADVARATQETGAQAAGAQDVLSAKIALARDAQTRQELIGRTAQVAQRGAVMGEAIGKGAAAGAVQGAGSEIDLGVVWSILGL